MTEPRSNRRRPTVDVRRRDGRRPAPSSCPPTSSTSQVNIPLIHQVVVAQLAAARQGTHDTKTPRRGPRRRPQAVPPEGHRPGPPGLDPRAAVRRRRRRPRPAPARLRAAHPEEDEGRRAARRALRPRPRRPRPRASPAWSTGEAPSTKDALAALAQVSDARHVLVVVDRERRRRVEVRCATSPSVHLLVAGPAQHLRRAGLRRRGVHPGRARGVPRRPDPRQGRQGRRQRGRAAETRSRHDHDHRTPATSCSRPVVSEKSYGLLDENKYTFLVAPGRQQDPDQDRGRAGLRRQGHSTSTRSTARASALRTRTGFGKRKDTKRAIVTPGRGRPHRHLRRPGRLAAGPADETADRGQGRMGIRKYKPTTPGRRGSSVADFVEVTRREPEKSLVRPLHSKGGRNNHGRVTTRHQGGGHKRAYRVIDFRRARQGRRAGQGRAHRVRPEPHRADRAAALRRRREALHHRAEPAAARATASRPARRPTSSRATPCRCATSRSAP